MWHIMGVKWEVEYTDEFGLWWETLQEMEQASIDAGVSLLEDYGPSLPIPKWDQRLKAWQYARAAHTARRAAI